MTRVFKPKPMATPRPISKYVISMIATDHEPSGKFPTVQLARTVHCGTTPGIYIITGTFLAVKLLL